MKEKETRKIFYCLVLTLLVFHITLSKVRLASSKRKINNRWCFNKVRGGGGGSEKIRKINKPPPLALSTREYGKYVKYACNTF